MITVEEAIRLALPAGTEIVAGQSLEIDRCGKDHFGRTLAYIRDQARMSARW